MVAVALFADAGNEMGDMLHGKFGMNLEQAKNHLLAKAKEIGLEPTSESTSKNGKSLNVCFYEMFRSKNKDKNPAGGPPWLKLHKLAQAYGVNYDTGGDPPWSYTLKVEETPPEGQYITV